MSVLPSGWLLTQLGTYIEVKNGYAFKSSDYISQNENSVAVLRISDIQNGAVTTQSASHVPSKLAMENFRVHRGDLLIAMSGATTGKTGVYSDDTEAYQNQRVGNIKLLSEQLGCRGYRDFLVRYLTNDILKKAYGAAQPNISAKAIEELIVPIAPLNEQVRIADKLDSILGKVNKAQARLDKIPAILKRFRQSVLAAATSGELTKEWREFNKVDKGSWQQFSIDELSSRAFDGPFGSKLKTADYTEFGVKVVRLENIGHLTFKGDKETFISEKKYQDLIKNTLEHNDILFSSFVDEEIRTCLFEARDNTYINKADCFCIRVSGEKISPKFLMYNLGCKHTFDKIKKQVHGVTRPRINLRFLKSFEVSVPTIEEQIRIVEIIDALFHKAAKVEAQFLETKSKLDRLTQSILAKAFRGELVSQSDKDESAEALLKRIKVESPKVKSNK